MDSITWDWPLFEALNFDGGEVMDMAMEAVSGVAMWIPLYIAILYMVWRKYSWRGLGVFVLAVALAMGLADFISAIFKLTGPLEAVLPELPVRRRPMFTEGIASMHVPSFDHGIYGTVSSHAATIVALALLSSMVIRRRWFTPVMTLVALLICYSRIYLACHFPQDIIIGAVAGALSAGVGMLFFEYIFLRRTK